MPEFYATSILAHNGKAVQPGQQLTLDQEVADRLGKKVVPVEVATPTKPYDQMLMKELRPLAKAAGIEGYSTKERGELLAALQPLQVVSEDAEQPGDVEPSGD